MALQRLDWLVQQWQHFEESEDLGATEFIKKDALFPGILWTFPEAHLSIDIDYRSSQLDSED